MADPKNKEIYALNTWHNANNEHIDVTFNQPLRIKTSVKLHLRDERTNRRTGKETRTRTNNVHHDRRRHILSTSLRLVNPLQKTHLFVRSTVSYMYWSLTLSTRSTSRSDVDTAWQWRSWYVDVVGALRPCVSLCPSVRSFVRVKFHLRDRWTDGPRDAFLCPSFLRNILDFKQLPRISSRNHI